MEKDLIITPPEGYEVDKERSTFERIVFKKKSLKYKDVTEELFKIEDDCVWFVTPYSHGDFFTSAKQSKKLVAINTLLNVAKYLNGNWVPDWNDGTEKYSIKIDYCGYIVPEPTLNSNNSFVYFKTRELVKQAIEILGEEIIKVALSTDW